MVIVAVEVVLWSLYSSATTGDEFDTYHQLNEIRQNVQMLHNAAMLGAYHPAATERAAWLGQAAMIHNLTLHQFEDLLHANGVGQCHACHGE